MASGYQHSYEADLSTHDHSSKHTSHSTNEGSLPVEPQTGSNFNTPTRSVGHAKNTPDDAMAFSESLGIIITRPKYKKYQTVSAREETFANWTKRQDKYELARAGFVFTGKEDIATCFFCGINLKDWPLNACPWEQHAIASPKCGHLLHCKGKSFIESCLEERNGAKYTDACDVIDIVQLALGRNKEAVKLAKEYISDEELLKRSVKRLLRDNLSGAFTATQLVQMCLELEDENNGSQQETSTRSEQEETESDDDSDLEETNRRLKEPVVCKICYDAIACVITLPCGHLVCCSQCVSALSTCAVCRSEIKGTIRAVMAV